MTRSMDIHRYNNDRYNNDGNVTDENICWMGSSTGMERLQRIKQITVTPDNHPVEPMIIITCDRDIPDITKITHRLRSQLIEALSSIIGYRAIRIEYLRSSVYQKIQHDELTNHRIDQLVRQSEVAEHLRIHPYLRETFCSLEIGILQPGMSLQYQELISYPTQNPPNIHELSAIIQVVEHYPFFRKRDVEIIVREICVSENKRHNSEKCDEQQHSELQLPLDPILQDPIILPHPLDTGIIINNEDDPVHQENKIDDTVICLEVCKRGLTEILHIPSPYESPLPVTRDVVSNKELNNEKNEDTSRKNSNTSIKYENNSNADSELIRNTTSLILTQSTTAANPRELCSSDLLPVTVQYSNGKNERAFDGGDSPATQEDIISSSPVSQSPPCETNEHYPASNLERAPFDVQHSYHSCEDHKRNDERHHFHIDVGSPLVNRSGSFPSHPSSPLMVPLDQLPHLITPTDTATRPKTRRGGRDNDSSPLGDGSPSQTREHLILSDDGQSHNATIPDGDGVLFLESAPPAPLEYEAVRDPISVSELPPWDAQRVDVLQTQEILFDMNQLPDGEGISWNSSGGEDASHRQEHLSHIQQCGEGNPVSIETAMNPQIFSESLSRQDLVQRYETLRSRAGRPNGLADIPISIICCGSKGIQRFHGKTNQEGKCRITMTLPTSGVTRYPLSPTRLRAHIPPPQATIEIDETSDHWGYYNPLPSLDTRCGAVSSCTIELRRKEGNI